MNFEETVVIVRKCTTIIKFIRTVWGKNSSFVCKSVIVRWTGGWLSRVQVGGCESAHVGA